MYFLIRHLVDSGTKLQMRGCHGVVDEFDDRIFTIARDSHFVECG